jgi:hypothetical protein
MEKRKRLGGKSKETKQQKDEGLEREGVGEREREDGERNNNQDDIDQATGQEPDRQTDRAYRHIDI